MTNETTASQPKSIGDDAQFLRLMYEWSCTSGESRMRASKALTDYLDSKLRAPAAQASATIQAAPAVRPDQCSDEQRNAVYMALHYYMNVQTPDEWKATDEAIAAFLAAATIQEPVMVAEPVAGCRMHGGICSCTSGGSFGGCRIKRGFPEQKAMFAAPMVAEKSCYCGGWDDVHQQGCPEEFAPMVADPAGVAVPPLPELESLADLAYAQNTPAEWDADYRSTWQKLQVESRNSMQWRVYALKLRYILAAATVKAVPSEALDEVLERAADACMRAVPDRAHVRRIGEAAHYVACAAAVRALKSDAAPLADKTGGGE